MFRHFFRLIFALSAVVILSFSNPAFGQELFVTSTFTDEIKRYDGTTGAFIDNFVTAGSGGVGQPQGITFGPDGNLYVTGNYNSTVKRYNGTTGAFLGDFGSGLSNPGNLQFGPDGNLYVTNRGNIIRIDGATGLRIDPPISGLDTVLALTFAPNGELLAATSTSASIIKRYNFTTGEYLGDFVPSGGGGLSFPADLTFGSDSNLYVTSAGNNRVQRYNGSTGAYMGDFVSSGSGGLSVPVGIAFGQDGNLYVSSYLTDSVQRYNGTTGAYIDDFVPSGGLDGPNFIVFRPSIVTVGGIIALQGTQNAIQPIVFTFRPTTGSAFTRSVNLNFAGGYNFTGIPAGEYTVSIKGAKWLRKNIAINARTGDVTNANAMLLAGDANNDNFADITDLLLLIAHYNEVSPNAGFSDAADFNCDGVDDIADLLLLVANYNKQGDS